MLPMRSWVAKRQVGSGGPVRSSVKRSSVSAKAFLRGDGPRAGHLPLHQHGTCRRRSQDRGGPATLSIKPRIRAT